MRWTSTSMTSALNRAGALLGALALAAGLSAAAAPVVDGWFAPGDGRWTYNVYLKKGEDWQLVTPAPILASTLALPGLVAGQTYDLKALAIGPVAGLRTMLPPWKATAFVPGPEADPKVQVMAYGSMDKRCRYGIVRRQGEAESIVVDRIDIGSKGDIGVLRLRAMDAGGVSSVTDIGLQILPGGRCDLMPKGASEMVADVCLTGSMRVGLGYQEGKPGGVQGMTGISDLPNFLAVKGRWTQLHVPFGEMREEPNDVVSNLRTIRRLTRSADLGVVGYRLRLKEWSKGSVLYVRDIYFK